MRTSKVCLILHEYCLIRHLAQTFKATILLKDKTVLGIINDEK
jgi:hypothetical protein